MNKRGIELSFSFIFAVILIGAIVGISFYVINHFLVLGKCADVGLFYKDFQDEVDDAWRAEISRKTFEGTLPNGIDEVCIGNIGQCSGEDCNELRKYTISTPRANIFLLPPDKACDAPAVEIEHVEYTGFECIDVIDNKVNIRLEKTSTDSLVKVGR